MPSSRIITSVLFIAAAVGGCAAPELRSSQIEPDWEASFVRTSGWTGADGAASIPLPNNRVLWLFGDSFIGPVESGRHMPGTTMVNNTIAIGPMRRTPPTERELTFHWGYAQGKPAAWCVPDQPDRWFWPASGGIVAPGPDGRDRLILFMTRLSRVDNSDSIWNFRARGTTLTFVTNPADSPAEWKQSQSVINEFAERGPQIGWGFAVLRDGLDPGRLLIYGIDTTNNFDRKVVLARAPSATVEDVATWRFLTARGWDTSPTDLASLAAQAGPEVSVHKLNDRYVMVYSHPMLGAEVYARVSRQPEGPWSEARQIYLCPEPAQDKKLLVYSAKAHPELSGPRDLLISYCVNSTEFTDVLEHADRYRPRFVRVPIDSVGNLPK